MGAVLMNAAILGVVFGAGLMLWRPSMYAWLTWRAMTTPLASIIGSGFLVLGPLLALAYGKYAPMVMAALCAAAYAFGWAIRYNMQARETLAGSNVAAVDKLETLSSWALSFAYVISVAYYLNLLGAFAVSLTPFHTDFHGRLVASTVFAIILLVGWTRGFRSLEAMEYVSVTLKLAIICGLLMALGVFFSLKALRAELVFNAPGVTGWHALTLSFGLIVTVQGFETSRYLGQEYSLGDRLGSMRWAQLISSAIYMAYICLFTYVFDGDQLHLSETAIVNLMVVVATVLPALLVAAAIAAQFSAAVADTGGAGGLVAEVSGGRIAPRVAYAVLAAAGLALTWMANVFEIIAYASRAFAFYYMLQATIAALNGRAARDTPRASAFALLALLGVMIMMFGEPAER